MNTSQEPASEEPIQLGTYERPRDYLPERETYEALCRGEGVKMVRREECPEPSIDLCDKKKNCL